MSRRVILFAVGSPYAWDVVESVRRAGAEPVCVDNLGGADARLPGLTRAAEPGPFVLGLSSAEHRPQAARAALEAGHHEPLVLVDPTSVVATTAILGHGTYVNAGVVVASHATLGCHVNVNRSVSLGHDTDIGSFASFGPGAVLAGGVRVGAATFVGAGATVLPEVTLGPGAVVGAGAVVTRDVARGDVVVGNPARVVRTLEVQEQRCPHC
jgi:sugar O-acyltransferase (sialic acid O-acetyltransferase NeuD family)